MHCVPKCLPEQLTLADIPAGIVVSRHRKLLGKGKGFSWQLSFHSPSFIAGISLPELMS